MYKDRIRNEDMRNELLTFFLNEQNMHYCREKWTGHVYRKDDNTTYKSELKCRHKVGWHEGSKQKYKLISEAGTGNIADCMKYIKQKHLSHIGILDFPPIISCLQAGLCGRALLAKATTTLTINYCVQHSNHSGLTLVHHRSKLLSNKSNLFL
jgi:hypothetical protein